MVKEGEDYIHEKETAEKLLIKLIFFFLWCTQSPASPQILSMMQKSSLSREVVATTVALEEWRSCELR